MGTTSSIFQNGARSIENGKNDASPQSAGWGDAASPRTLGANNGIPWISFDTKPDITEKEDNSITNNAFPAAPRLTAKGMSKGLSFNDRFAGQNDLLYWMFGFESHIVQVVVFRSTETDPWAGDPPTAGDIYTPDGETTNFTYLRTETYRDPNTNIAYSQFIFENDNDDVLPSAGTMDGVTNPTFDFIWTTRSDDLFEHLYELDKYGRKLRTYVTAEQAITGWEADDLRNIMMTLGKRFDSYDQRIPNCLCKSWNWKQSVGEFAMFDTTFLGYILQQGDYSSANWTMQSGGNDLENVPMHMETAFNLGTIFSGGSSDMVTLGMQEVGLTCDIPLDEAQSYISGLYLAEPILNAKYALSISGIVSRHDAQTYETARDARTPMCAQIISTQGWLMREFLIQKIILNDAGPDSSPVVQEPLAGGIMYNAPASDPFKLAGYSHLQGFSTYHDSPIYCRVRNDSSQNEMFRN